MVCFLHWPRPRQIPRMKPIGLGYVYSNVPNCTLPLNYWSCRSVNRRQDLSSAFRLLWILSCFTCWGDIYTPSIPCSVVVPHLYPLHLLYPIYTMFSCCTPSIPSSLVVPPLYPLHLLYPLIPIQHLQQGYALACSELLCVLQCCTWLPLQYVCEPCAWRDIKYHVVLCLWRQDHSWPARQGLPFILHSVLTLLQTS